MKRCSTAWILLLFICLTSLLLGEDWQALVCNYRGARLPGHKIVTVPINTTTDVPGSSVDTFISPLSNFYCAIGITPDGKKAYVVNQTKTVIPVLAIDGDSVSYSKEIPISLSAEQDPSDIAITPDGTKAYVSLKSGGVMIIDVATDTELPKITGLPSGLTSIAISPDGTKAYVTSSDNNTVIPIDLASNLPLTPISLAPSTSPQGIAISPDGSKIYVANFGGSMSIINLITSQISTFSINPDLSPINIAATPDGKKVLVSGNGNTPQAYIYDVELRTVSEATFSLGTFSSYGLAITPDSKKAYVGNFLSNTIGVIDLTDPLYPTTTIDLELNAKNSGICITPDQAPTARFLATANRKVVQFDASSSSSPVGTITTYAWDFGDGNTETTSSPTVSHTYRHSGGFAVSLVVTNSAGTSLTKTFTGHTVGNNGGSTAQCTQQVFTTPLPVTGFTGQVHIGKNNKVSVVTSWGKSQSTDVKKYEIFAFHKKIRTISAKKDPSFLLRLHPHHAKTLPLSEKYQTYIQNKYRIRAVASDGKVSGVTHLTMTQ